MRVLFTAIPGWGHVHPMVPLARAFVARGDEVSWAVAAPVCERLRRDGFDAEPAGIDEVDGHREFAARHPEAKTLAPIDLPEFMFSRIFGAVWAPKMLDDLLPLARDVRPSLMVHDAAELAGPIVAAVLGIPSVAHGFGPLLPPARVASANPVVAPLWARHGLDVPPYAGTYQHGYLDIYPPSLQVGNADHVPVRLPLRPVTYAARGDEPLPPLVTAPSADPLVYVTFGTVFNRNVDVIRTVVEGVRALPVRVVVTLGPRGEPHELGPQPNNVHVTRYIAQTELLAHCAAVVSHAGSGTFLASLALGLPQLCVPQAADQFLNAAACTRAGVGLTLLPGTVTAEAVKGAVSHLLDDAAWREAAVRVSGDIAAMPSPDDVAASLADRFARL
jgi:UDP:flavonoid glycosyltransferase YjiC (YdhE family)